MSFGGFNPSGSSDLPFTNPGGSGMRSRASSVSSVHSNHSSSSAHPPPPPTSQQQQQHQQQHQSPYQSPYNSRPGTPLGAGGEGYGVASGYGASGYGSGSSSPASYHSPTPPIPNQQRQQHYGYGAPMSKQQAHAGTGYDSPTGISSSIPAFYGADLQQQHQRHSRSHSNASETSLNIDTSGLGGMDGPYSPGLGSAGGSSAASSRRGSVSSESGSMGSFFGRKIGKTFRPQGPEPHQAPEDYYGSENDSGADGSEDVDMDLDHDMSDAEARKKATIMRTRMAKSAGLKGFRGGRGGGRMRDLFNDWDLLLPNTKADPYEDDDEGLNEDEKWKRRQMVKRGWESPRGQIILLTLLTMLAVLVRIWKLAVPSAVVFDEQHFGGFAADYVRGEFFMDLHPPLGKMLYAMVAYFLRFDGNFHFTPGSLYPKNVPYIGMRLFAVACGVGLIPVSYMTIRRSGHSTQAAFTCAILMTFENAMITQSRFILLDAPMMLFMGYTLLAWINFYNHRNRPFTRGWWVWLVQTGFGLFLSSSVKWVGLFTIATIGVCVLKYLQEARTHLYVSTFVTLFLCLLVMPAFLYLGLHVVDFRLLNRSGSGNAWVSPQFQMTLKGHDVLPVMADVAWDSKVHIRHANTNGGWIHSMPGEPTREGVKDQAIQLVEWDDDLTCWQIYPADPALREQHTQHKYDRKYDPSIEFEGFIYEGDGIRLRHCYSKVALATNDIESVGSNKTFIREVRGIKWSKKPAEETIWRLELVAEGLVPGLADYHGLKKGKFTNDGKLKTVAREMKDDVPVAPKSGDPAAAAMATEEKVRPARDQSKQWHSIKGFRLWNEKQKCYLQSSKVFRAPYSTYQEVGCIQDGKQKANTIFIVDQNVNPHLPESTVSLSYTPLTFFQKFKELNRVMWWTHHDLSAPVHGDDHADQGSQHRSDESRPWTWPLMRKGMNYYSSKETNHYVYFMGNPLLWWTSTGAVVLYIGSCLLSVLQFLQSKNVAATSTGLGRQRIKNAVERDRFGITPFYAVASGTFFAGWAIHYLPFFFMSRQVFLHHYLPALYFSILLLVSRLDRLWSSWPGIGLGNSSSSGGGGRSNAVVTSGRLRLLVGVGLMATMIMSWWMFAPLSYGTDFASKAQCERLRAMGGWKFICQRQDLPWARPGAAAAAAAAEAEAARKLEEDEDDDDESQFYYNGADDHNSVEGSVEGERHNQQQQEQEQVQQHLLAQADKLAAQKAAEDADHVAKTMREAESMAREFLEKQQLMADKMALEEKQRLLEERLEAQERELEQQRLLQKQRELEKTLHEQEQEQERLRQLQEQMQQQHQAHSETTKEMLEEQVRILMAQLEANQLKQQAQHQQYQG
ncbi:hypothetical protein BGZ83_010316 [Gryganskiella cystojenkinii]|nr:hypothetical protein BGZ83_010316 [Gryganskiella cystojenkinii]